MNVLSMLQYLYSNKIKIALYAFAVFFLFIISSIIITFFIAWISYICIKYIKLKIFGQLENITDYNDKSKRVLNKYGHCRIKRIYLVRAPLDTKIDFLFNMISLYNWDKYKLENTYHIFLLFEVEVSEKVFKHIVVEKINGIYIKSDYIINKNNELIPIKFDKSVKYTISDLLQQTQERLNLHKFYNWSVNGHCQIFTKNMLKCIKTKTKYKKYFNLTYSSSKFSELFSEFTKHLLEWCVHISSYQYTLI